MGKDAEATLLVRIKEAGGAILDHFVVTFGDLVEITKKLGEVLLEPLEQFRKQELAVNSLNTAMVAQGVYTRELSDQYQEMAKSLQKVTLYSDDQIIQAQAQLQSFLGTTQVTKELTMATLDFATANRKDLATSAEIVGKSITSATNALQREGIAVDVTADKQTRLAQVISGIEGKWKDQARAAADGLGVWKQLQNSFEDLQKMIGERLAPIVTALGQQIKSLADATDNARPLVDGLVIVFGYLAQAISYAFAEVKSELTAFFGLLPAIGTAIDQIVHGQFKQAMDTLKEGAKSTTDSITATWQAHAERVAAIDDAMYDRREMDLAKEDALLKQSAINKAKMAGDQAAIELTNQQLKNDQEILNTQTHLDELKNLSLTAQLDRINSMLMNEQSATMQNALEQRKRVIMQQMTSEELKRSETALFEFRKAQNAARLADQQSTLSTISTLSQSHSKELAAIGKAAAITQIAIETPVAVAKALAAFPPPFNFVAAGLVGAAMAVQAAQIAGVPLAEGGIVRATPGGTPAIIGEGGRDEAVIPLDSPEAAGRLGGGGNTFIFQGPVMGDRTQAQEFAKMIDKELLQLRRNGESLAFDSRIS
jgi:hypothetical protein